MNGQARRRRLSTMAGPARHQALATSAGKDETTFPSDDGLGAQSDSGTVRLGRRAFSLSQRRAGTAEIPAFRVLCAMANVPA